MKCNLLLCYEQEVVYSGKTAGPPLVKVRVIMVIFLSPINSVDLVQRKYVLVKFRVIMEIVLPQIFHAAESPPPSKNYCYTGNL